MQFDEFRVLTFDCYGTLIDWETGILGVLRPWATRAGITADDTQLLAAFGEAESAAQRATPGAIYPEILRDTHARMSAHFGVKPDAHAAAAFGNSVGDWPAFRDTPDALRRLQRRHKLMIVSNVDRASFARTQPKLGVTFDAVVTAEEVGAYKPDLKMFHRALEISAGWGFSANQILHVGQSLFHDHAPAKTMGLKSAWVKRPSPREELGATRDPGEEVKPDLVVSSLAELANVIDTKGVT